MEKFSDLRIPVALGFHFPRLIQPNESGKIFPKNQAETIKSKMDQIKPQYSPIWKRYSSGKEKSTPN
ncbi:uncharacterized protein G2W53_043013 [Senna tora]|uniref:Uncharacterized protein n=1 Tax=Senna tora TaxID=362788 RepID=A0A834VZZ0_9FABA|nr:uncharacterized protein G2W53_043013 [Senna tora]